MSDLILREFNGVEIRQRADGYVCLTDMGKATGKLFAKWYRLKSTIELLEVLQNEVNEEQVRQSSNVQMWTLNDHRISILDVNEGRVGTYGHPKVAIAFATWCSPKFFSVVINWTQEILTKGGVIAEHATSEQLQALQGQITILQAENKQLDNCLNTAGYISDYCDIFTSFKNRVFDPFFDVEDFTKWLADNYGLCVDLNSQDTCYLRDSDSLYKYDKFRHATIFAKEYLLSVEDESNLARLNKFLS